MTLRVEKKVRLNCTVFFNVAAMYAILSDIYTKYSPQRIWTDLTSDILESEKTINKTQHLSLGQWALG